MVLVTTNIIHILYIMDNIPKPPSFEQYINKITTKVGYLDKYGGSVIVTMITLFVFFLLFSYLYIIARLKPIKNDWENQRCNPEVMPFAGFINKKPGQSAFDFTSENFTNCTEMILIKFVGYFKELEEQMCQYTADTIKSPDRLDAFVYAIMALQSSGSAIFRIS